MKSFKAFNKNENLPYYFLHNPIFNLKVKMSNVIRMCKKKIGEQKIWVEI